MSKRHALLVLVLCGPAVGACHSPLGDLAIRAAGPAVDLDAGYGAEQLAAGRKALDEGQLGLAVTAFRNARQFPAQASDATNGLAITYAQLGRPDLAERYFQQAIAMAPADKRYQANLLRFYKANPAEPARTTAMPAMAQRESYSTPAPANRLRGAVTASRPAARLQRLSSNEVQISGGRPGEAAPGLRNAPRHAAVTVQPRVAAAGRSAYPATMALRSSRTGVQVAAATPAEGKSAYPVKIELAPNR